MMRPPIRFAVLFCLFVGGSIITAKKAPTIDHDKRPDSNKSSTGSVDNSNDVPVAPGLASSDNPAANSTDSPVAPGSVSSEKPAASSTGSGSSAAVTQKTAEPSSTDNPTDSSDPIELKQATSKLPSKQLQAKPEKMAGTAGLACFENVTETVIEIENDTFNPIWPTLKDENCQKKLCEGVAKEKGKQMSDLRVRYKKDFKQNTTKECYICQSNVDKGCGESFDKTKHAPKDCYQYKLDETIGSYTNSCIATLKKLTDAKTPTCNITTQKAYCGEGASPKKISNRLDPRPYFEEFFIRMNISGCRKAYIEGLAVVNKDGEKDTEKRYYRSCAYLGGVSGPHTQQFGDSGLKRTISMCNDNGCNGAYKQYGGFYVVMTSLFSFAAATGMQSC